MRAIQIAELPNSFNKELTNLYRGLGMQRAWAGKMEEAFSAFAIAMEKAKDKNGKDATGVLLTWIYYLRQTGQIHLALEKLDVALKNSKILKQETRGTLLTDSLQMFALICASLGRQAEAKSLFQQAQLELQAQRKINSKLEPNIFCR